LPDNYTLIVNTEHPLIEKIKENADADIADKVAPIAECIKQKNNVISAMRDANKNEKMSDEDSQKLAEIESEIANLRDEQNNIITQYAARQDTVKQLIDLALLGNGLLKGESLSQFIKRSVSML
jgi:molecular chaperone HtpG